MPFTLSHPAAIIPFSRSRLFVFSALITGSMAPDFLYFIPENSWKHFGHTMPGIILVCIPCSLVFLWVFHNFLKCPVLDLLPECLQKRVFPYMTKFHFRPGIHFMKIIISILIGITTHIIWDSMTHPYGFLVKRIAFLNEPFIIIKFEVIKVYKILQHMSTIGGILIIEYFIINLYHESGVIPELHINSFPGKRKNKILLIMILLALEISFITSMFIYYPYVSFDCFKRFFVFLVVRFMAVFLIEILIYSIIWHRYNKTTDP
jgi:uncharacterized protein DUF4184